MPEFDDPPFEPEKFSGGTRLFPLPNLVMFPHVLQPLHIFEPRYRELMQAALQDDRLMTIVQLRSGWEKDYEGRPAVASVGCLGRIATHQRLKDGRYNLLLQGICRVQLLRELPPVKLFREAEVKLLPDIYTPGNESRREQTYRELLASFKRVLPQAQAAQESMDQFLTQPLPLGVLADIVSFTLDLSQAVKQALLEEQDVDLRAAVLLEKLSAAAGDLMPGRAKLGRFPPDFSPN